MGLELYIASIAAIANVAMGLVVFVFNKQSATNKFFFYLCLSIASWIIATYLSLHATAIDVALFWTRAVMLTATAQSLFVYLLVITFPDHRQPLKSARYHLLLVIGVAVGIITMSPYLFTGLTTAADGSYSPTPGPGFAAFLPYALGLVFSGLFVLIKKYLSSRGTRRHQIFLLLLGLGLMFGLIIVFNLFLPLLNSTNEGIALSPLFTVIFVGFTTYAIVTQHLFDIRVFIRRTVIFASLLTFIFVVYATVLTLFAQLFQLDSLNSASFVVNLIAALIIGYSFQPLKVWVSERTDKWLFKKEYEQEVVIKELSQKLNNVIALDEALEVVMQTTAKALHLHHAVTYVFQQADRGEQAIKRIKQIGYATTQRLILEERDFVMHYFCSNPKIIFTENLEAELAHEKLIIEGKRKLETGKTQAELIREHAIRSAVAKKLQQLEVAVAMPLTLKDQPIGLILLSSKQSNESYSKQDLTLLELVGDQAISSIQKAKLYEGDQMKSEFVSIASHELLTPISAIEGYLSMILDEKIAGQGLDPQTTDYLSKCFSSAKRLSMLVKDLLSVSRIESGKMKFTAQQLDSTKSIQDTLDQLRFIAQEKNITLKFKKPEVAFPPVLADPDRTSQVLINLVSNAIKYNRPGGEVAVTTELLKKERMVSITVKDTGLGMDKEQMSHLFEKFYRVDSKETVGIIGTGLGLYITKSIVERMGGSIVVQSTPGKGSTFTFTLPLLEVEKSLAA